MSGVTFAIDAGLRALHADNKILRKHDSCLFLLQSAYAHLPSKPCRAIHGPGPIDPYRAVTQGEQLPQLGLEGGMLH
jgi:hypothetical protein